MEAQCLIAAGEPGAAIASLESVTKSARTAEMSATLAKVYETSGLRRYGAKRFLDLLFLVPTGQVSATGATAGCGHRPSRKESRAPPRSRPHRFRETPRTGAVMPVRLQSLGWLHAVSCDARAAVGWVSRRTVRRGTRDGSRPSVTIGDARALAGGVPSDTEA